MNKDNRSFFTIVFITSWLLWLPTLINTQLIKVPSIFLLLGMFAGFVPSIVGLLMLRKKLGRDFKRHIIEKVNFRFPKKYLLVMLIFPAQGALTLFMVKILDQGFEVVNPISPIMYIPVFLQILMIGGALGEEFGWRGYAYKALHRRHGVLLGTLILGLLWSIWHLPLFFMENTVQSHLPMWQFIIQNTVLAFFYSWLYHKTNGNLVVMVLLHAILNTSAAIFPYWQSDLGRYLGLFFLLLLLGGIKVIDKSSFKVQKE